MEMKVEWSSNIMGGNVSLTTSDQEQWWKLRQMQKQLSRPFLTQDLTTFIKKASMTLSHVGTNVFNLMELTLIKYIFIT